MRRQRRCRTHAPVYEGRRCESFVAGRQRELQRLGGDELVEGVQAWSLVDVGAADEVTQDVQEALHHLRLLPHHHGAGDLQGEADGSKQITGEILGKSLQYMSVDHDDFLLLKKRNI